MKFTAKSGLAFGLMLLLAFALSGCTHLDRGVRLNGDGSGSYSYAVGLSSQLVGLASDQITASMDEAGSKVKAQGGQYRHYEDTGYSYWEFTRPFNSVSQLNQMLQESSVPGLDTTSGSLPDVSSVASQPTDTFSVSEDSNLLTNTFHVGGSMRFPGFDPSTLDPGGTGTPGLPPETLTQINSLLADAHEKFSITMPGWVTSHDGGTVDGNTVTYLVHPGDSVTIDVVGGGLNTTVVYPLSGGALLLILLIAGGAVFLLIRRRNAARREALAPAIAPAVAPAPADAPMSPDTPTSPDIPTWTDPIGGNG
ncbi:MAG TPA: hypothetical protein VHR15_06485 [Ktedonobacterales bacterium]|jgi:hypothetical protein|nr:hypothetical protein [Ktedonobacterales bacterium]